MTIALAHYIDGERVTAGGQAEGDAALKVRVEPEHVASLVLFLASDDGRMCTGHEYWIDAGWR